MSDNFERVQLNDEQGAEISGGKLKYVSSSVTNEHYCYSRQTPDQKFGFAVENYMKIKAEETLFPANYNDQEFIAHLLNMGLIFPM